MMIRERKAKKNGHDHGPRERQGGHGDPEGDGDDSPQGGSGGNPQSGTVGQRIAEESLHGAAAKREGSPCQGNRENPGQADRQNDGG